MRLKFFDNKSVTSRTLQAACLALVALAATQARADQIGRPIDDGAARPLLYRCWCQSCTCLNCDGSCDLCLPRPWPKPVPKPWPKPYPWLMAPLGSDRQ